MYINQYLKMSFLFICFAGSFPQGSSPGRPSNAALVSNPEDHNPENVVQVQRAITVGDTTINIGAYTVGGPGGATPLPATTSHAPTSTATKPTKSSINAPIPTNPWSSACPIPSSFTVNNFVFVSGNGGDVSFIISYGDGSVISCPNQGQEYLALGVYDLTCGNDTAVHAQTDGSTWLFINERYSCASSGSGAATLSASTNYTSFGNNLFCDTDDANVKTCLQLNPDIAFPVLRYDTTGSIAY